MPTQLNEQPRLEALRSLNLLDTPPEAEFDELVTLAAEICSVPITAVSLVDSERQWCKATFGRIDQEVPRDLSFCSHAIQRDEMFIVEDALLDPRFNHNALVTGPPGIRFYAGVPLSSNGHNIGALCVIDTIPRKLTSSQRNALSILAHQVQARLDSRSREQLLEQTLDENQRLTHTLTARNNLFRAFMNNGPFVSYIKDSDGRFLFYNQRMRDIFGVKADDWMGKDDRDIWPPDMARAFRAHDVSVLQGGVPVILEEKTPGPDGAPLNWRSYKFPLANENGEIMLAGISVDITEEIKQKHALEQTLAVARQVSQSLDRSHALFRTFLDNIPYHCYLKSEDGKYLFYNQQFAQHFGIHPSKWIGRTDHDLVPGRLADQLRAHDLRALASDQIIEAIGEFANAEGVLSTFKLLKFRCTDEDGSTLLACVAVDITGELHRQQALTEANQKLEQLAASDSLTGLSNRRTFDAQLVPALCVDPAQPAASLADDSGCRQLQAPQRHLRPRRR